MRFLVLIFLSFQILTAQKVVKKSFINPEVETISIDVNNCFEVVVATVDSNEMLLEATIEGEYKKDLLLNSKQEGHTVQVSSGFSPIFKNPNDKLSAHKVISISLKISVPEYKKVTIYGNNCNVSASGTYRDLEITLNDGKCVLNNVSESVTVMTQSGDISVYTKGAEILASSKYGSIENEELPVNDNRYDLTTITGYICIKKTE